MRKFVWDPCTVREKGGGRGGGGGYTFLVALFMTGVTHLLVGSSLYKGPHILTTAGQELLRVFRVELF